MNNEEIGLSPSSASFSAALNMHHMIEAYTHWAPVYDLMFGKVFEAGRNKLAKVAGRHTEICVAGVGTGLELPLFDPTTSVIGVDLSEPMLQRARKRVQHQRLCHVKSLIVMDAGQLAFSDESFDIVAAPYVLTTLPDPSKSLNEFWRLVRKEGELLIVNHIAAKEGPRAWVERCLAKRSTSLGWHPEFPWSIIGDWLEQQKDASLIEKDTLGFMRLFTFLRIRKNPRLLE